MNLGLLTLEVPTILVGNDCWTKENAGPVADQTTATTSGNSKFSLYEQISRHVRTNNNFTHRN